MSHTIADYRRCATQGMTVREAAASLGTTPNAVYKATSGGTVKFSKGKLGRASNRAIDGAMPRIAIARIIRKRIMPTGDIAREAGLTVGSTLYHLKVMAKLGLVEMTEKVGMVSYWQPTPAQSEGAK